MTSPARPLAVVLYDGDCALCRRTVAFARRRDARGHLRFCTLQSGEGHRFLAQHGLPTDWIDSVVLLEDDRVSRRSTAVLRICRRLSSVWPLLYAGIVLPPVLRNWLYDAFARRRNG